MSRSHESSPRSLAALAAVVGFYALGLAIAAALVGTAIGAATGMLALGIPMEPIMVVGGLACVIALIIVFSLLPHVDTFKPPGPELRERDAPALFVELRTLAAALRVRAPMKVYLALDTATIAEDRGGWLGFGTRRLLVVGLADLVMLRRDELRALLAFALAKCERADTLLARLILRARTGIGRTVAYLDGTTQYIGKDFNAFAMLTAVARFPLQRYQAHWLRSTDAFHAAHEQRAQQLASAVVGNAMLASARASMQLGAPVFTQYREEALAPIFAQCCRPPLVQGFRAYVDSPDAGAGLRRRAQEANAIEVIVDLDDLERRVVEHALPNRRIEKVDWAG
ncbi:MAG TPA: hypothetical protein VG755_29645 [Nannocystaceae bacterium]|nr:hypothetical protein [Nannocystaceae bacterium]